MYMLQGLKGVAMAQETIMHCQIHNTNMYCFIIQKKNDETQD